MANKSCVKSSMAPYSYKFFSTHEHEISGWTILSRIIHLRSTNLGSINGDVQSDIATLAFNNREQLGDFHRRIIILQQEIILFVKTLSPRRFLFQFMKALSKSEKLKELFAPKMTDIINLLDNNRKFGVYAGGNTHGLYRYLDMIGALKTLIASGQCSHHIVPSSSIKYDT